MLLSLIMCVEIVWRTFAAIGLIVNLLCRYIFSVGSGLRSWWAVHTVWLEWGSRSARLGGWRCRQTASFPVGNPNTCCCHFLKSAASLTSWFVYPLCSLLDKFWTKKKTSLFWSQLAERQLMTSAAEKCEKDGRGRATNGSIHLAKQAIWEWESGNLRMHTHGNAATHGMWTKVERAGQEAVAMTQPVLMRVMMSALMMQNAKRRGWQMRLCVECRF